MDESYIAKLREIHTENVDGTEGSWVPWNVAAEKEGGEELLKEMVDAGTVLCRRNPKLPATSKIPWPLNQQIQHIVETFSNKKRKVTTESTDDGAGDFSNFQEAWHAQAAAAPVATNPPGKTDKTDPPDPNKTDAASKAAHSNIKKAHKNKN